MAFTQHYNEYEFILNNDLLTPEQKVKALQKLKENIDSQLKNKLVNDLIKKWSGGLFELASSAVPIGGAGKAGASIGGNVLKKTLGRKLSQEIGSGAMSGMASGAVFGVGQGMIEDKNPLALAVQYGASGLLLGGLTGGTLGYVEKRIKADKLINSKPTEFMTKQEKALLRKQGKQYYKNYLQGRQISDPFGNNINFPGSQSGEIKLHNNKMIPKIPEQIRNAKGIRQSNDKPNRLDAYNFNKLDNTYKNKNYEYIIRNNSNNTGNDFYQIKEVGSNPAYSYHNRALELEPNNIITDVEQTLNPSFKILPAWLSALFLSKNQTNTDALQENMPLNIPVLKGGVQMDVNLEDLTNLVNPETMKNTRIDEFENHQVVMDERTGIPANSDTVYVHPYTRDDGTEVKGYYRSKPSRI